MSLTVRGQVGQVVVAPRLDPPGEIGVADRPGRLLQLSYGTQQPPRDGVRGHGDQQQRHSGDDRVRAHVSTSSVRCVRTKYATTKALSGVSLVERTAFTATTTGP
jgi:hypothetical protein